MKSEFYVAENLFTQNCDGSKCSKRDPSILSAIYLSKSCKEKQSLYMTNRFNLSFYLNKNTDQQTELKYGK